MLISYLLSNGLPGLLNPYKLLPGWIAPILTIFFAILWGVWLLPHTVFIRHIAMVLGAVIGLYVCILNWHLFFKKEAVSIYVILLLIIWVVFHYLFIGTNRALQFQELTGVWKKIIICIPFALGLGIAIGQSKQKKICWNLFYLGLTLPTLIYFGKWVLTHNQIEWNIQSPYLLLNPNYSMPFGISRALYTFYCMPSFVIAHVLILKTKKNELIPMQYLIFVLLTPLLYYLEGDKAGLFICVAIFLITGGIFLKRFIQKFNFRTFILTTLSFILFILVISGAVNKFEQYDETIDNTRIALDVEKYDHWKFQGKMGRPINSKGDEINDSNYYRVAWFKVGLKLLRENPLGYGLLTLSFDHLSKEKWPNSILSMSHSGLLDFALGYGFVGLSLLLAASLLVVVQGFLMPSNWKIVIWGFCSLIIVIFLKELSYEITINAFIFILVFISGLLISYKESQHLQEKF